MVVLWENDVVLILFLQNDGTSRKTESGGTTIFLYD